MPQPLRFLNSHRIFFYSSLSLISVCTIVANALKNHSNFYAVAIHLSKSNRSVLVLANFGILLSLLGGHVVQRIFFGALRPNEVERLYDRLWFFITESLLAFTIFRDEFDTPFGLMFGFLLFIKSFHWLASDRIEWMDQRPYPGPPFIFHFRMVFLFAILWATDLIVFLFAVEHTLSTGVGGMVLFASEYGILAASLMNTILKYCLSTYDLRRAGRRGGENAPPWENKSMWIFYIELMTDFLKLSTYLVFFCVIITFYGLPLNIVRDVYITARSFITRLKALHRYQTATRNMDQRYPNATEEELTATSDRTCIICREEMVSAAVQEPNRQSDGPNMTPKKLPCGHIFHFQCLRSWLERQQSCPTCRRNVLDENNETRAPAAVAPVDQRRAGAGNQPQNALGPQLVARPNPQDRVNPLGFLGRFLGIPNPAQGNHVNGQQPGIFINYQVQYQFPRRQNEDNLQDEQAQPPPPFAGFTGPGGAWQPWPAQEVAQPQPTPNTTPVETPQTDGSPAADTQIPSTSENTPHSLEDQDSIPSAREAARQATLRRFGTKTDALSGPEATSSKSLSQPTTPTPTTTTTTTSASTSASGLRPPQLIPLFDFRDVAEALHTSIVAPTLVPGLDANSRSGATSITVSNTDSTATTPASVRSSRRLTEDQLAQLDTCTRESIDLRLRVLDGVSASLNECIDKLMELRSALPPIPGSSTTGASGSPSLSMMTAGSKEEENSAGDNKGKGKEKAPDVSLPAGEEPGLHVQQENVDS